MEGYDSESEFLQIFYDFLALASCSNAQGKGYSFVLTLKVLSVKPILRPRKLDSPGPMLRRAMASLLNTIAFIGLKVP